MGGAGGHLHRAVKFTLLPGKTNPTTGEERPAGGDCKGGGEESGSPKEMRGPGKGREFIGGWIVK